MSRRAGDTTLNYTSRCDVWRRPAHRYGSALARVPNWCPCAAAGPRRGERGQPGGSRTTGTLPERADGDRSTGAEGGDRCWSGGQGRGDDAHDDGNTLAGSSAHTAG
jgi:hypothetical protein